MQYIHSRPREAGTSPRSQRGPPHFILTMRFIVTLAILVLVLQSTNAFMFYLSASSKKSLGLAAQGRFFSPRLYSSSPEGSGGAGGEVRYYPSYVVYKGMSK
ncbi:hypothetical protein EON63_23480 [archaeon]|nr:MAG: hypothetical protein EON63_23480 [archaeon]